MDKQSYYGFKIGQTVKANVSKVHDGKMIDTGHEFKIISFPPKIRMLGDKHTLFVFGRDVNNNNIRLDLTEISK